MKTQRTLVYLLLLLSQPVISSEGSINDETKSALEVIASRISNNWDIVQASSMDGFRFEKRVSPSYRRFGLCSRSVVEVEVPDIPDRSFDDDIPQSIFFYRVYAPLTNSTCASSFDNYFGMSLDGLDEATVLDFAQQIIGRQWEKIGGSEQPHRITFNENVPEDERKCLLDGSDSIDLKGLQFSKSNAAIEGRVLLNSCVSARSLVVLHVSIQDETRINVTFEREQIIIERFEEF